MQAITPGPRSKVEFIKKQKQKNWTSPKVKRVGKAFSV